ncbi:restriction endonuclease [Chloroflexota bacterium]
MESGFLDKEARARLIHLYNITEEQWTWGDCIFMLKHDKYHNELCINEQCKSVLSKHAPIIIAMIALYRHIGKFCCLHCGNEHCKLTYRSNIFLSIPPPLSDIGDNPSNWLFLCRDCYYRNENNEYLYDMVIDPVKPRGISERGELITPGHIPFNSMTPKEFEDFVAHVFRLKGHTVQHVGGSGDDGIDLILERRTTKGIVQCKRQESKITPRMLREFVGALVGTDAKEAYFVTSGDFSDNAREWAKKFTLITLVNGETLKKWWSS